MGNHVANAKVDNGIRKTMIYFNKSHSHNSIHSNIFSVSKQFQETNLQRKQHLNFMLEEVEYTAEVLVYFSLNTQISERKLVQKAFVKRLVDEFATLFREKSKPLYQST